MIHDNKMTRASFTSLGKVGNQHCEGGRIPNQSRMRVQISKLLLSQRKRASFHATSSETVTEVMVTPRQNRKDLKYDAEVGPASNSQNVSTKK